MSELNLLAPAKINLTLEILGKRPDNFHDLTSIMMSVDLNDEIKDTYFSTYKGCPHHERTHTHISRKKYLQVKYSIEKSLGPEYPLSCGRS